MPWGKKWKGGRVFVTSNDEEVYVIRKMIAGKTFNIHLDVDNEDDAEIELRAFKRDPWAYKTQRQEQMQKIEKLREEKSQRIFMTGELIEDFIGALKKDGRSRQYLLDLNNYLFQWAEALKGKDLRTVGDGIKKIRATWKTARKHRTISFKSFTSWLEVEGYLSPEQNPGRFLKVDPARRKHDFKGYSIEVVEKLYAAIRSQVTRDRLALQALTGMHGSEVDRLARGDGSIKVLEDQGEIAGTITFRHKTGKPFTISVGSKALAAAQRLQARGSAPSVKGIQEHLQRLKKKNPRLEVVNFGALRHSFATWLLERGTTYSPKGGGLPMEAVSQALNHSSTRTTALHYASAQVPPMYKVPINLYHPEDPRPLPGKNHLRRTAG